LLYRIAVERKGFKIDLIPTVKMYYETATDSINGNVCALRYPCSLRANYFESKPVFQSGSNGKTGVTNKSDPYFKSS